MRKIDVLLGLQWGDEGKGKIVDVLTPEYDIILRFQGGPNAGHTLEFNGNKHILHTIPSGIFHTNTKNVIGNGVVIDPHILCKELDNIRTHNIEPSENLYIAEKTHLILPSHRLLDAMYEHEKGKKKIGSTLKGIGPTYADKISRNGLRVGDIFSDSFRHRYENLKQKHLQLIKLYNFDYSRHLPDGLDFNAYEESWLKSIDQVKKLNIINSPYFIHKELINNKKVLAEGAQGTLLDIDFGSYPYVTSSNTITAGLCTGIGVAPQKIGRVFGIFKAYCTRVGSGPFPTELLNEDGDKLRELGHEFGSTTGRSRRCGWLDIPALKYAIMLNGVTELFITKADVLNTFETLKVCYSYEINGKICSEIPYSINDLNIKTLIKEFPGWKSKLENIREFNQIPPELNNYIQYLENILEVPVNIISTGPNRDQILIRKKL